jgi:LCP family protein required for cell wall assembly
METSTLRLLRLLSLLMFLVVTMLFARTVLPGTGHTPLPTPSQEAAMVTVTRQDEAVSPTATLAASPSATPSPSRTLPATFTPLPSPSATPTATATATGTPTPTPTSTPTPFATLMWPPLTPVPTPVPAWDKPDGVTNVALLGNDVSGRRGGRTDTIIIVSINEETGTATMLSLPRDLYVVIPGWQMARINQAYPHGAGPNYPGDGAMLLKETILYNLGIPIDHFVRIGFDGFRDAVDLLGGVDLAVSCGLKDWRLKEPDLDPAVEENWELFDLGPGLWHMDGDLALWYARSRRTTNDFERGRRQQQLLRAMLEKGLSLELLPSLPRLWETYQDSVETDLTLPELVRLAALAPRIRENGIQHLFLTAAARRSWMTEGGAAVQLLQWEGAAPILGQLMRPPVLNRTTRAPIVVEVATRDNILYALAADNLAYHGFVAVRGAPAEETPNHTAVTYFGPSRKGSFDWLLAWIFGLEEDEITLRPDVDRTSAYRVVLGYDYVSCRPLLESPALGVEDTE